MIGSWTYQGPRPRWTSQSRKSRPSPVPRLDGTADVRSRRGAGRLESFPMAWDQLEQRPRVLLVEDAPFLRYAFGRLLRLHGYEVMEANDGNEALECIMRFR